MAGDGLCQVIRPVSAPKGTVKNGFSKACNHHYPFPRAAAARAGVVDEDVFMAIGAGGPEIVVSDVPANAEIGEAGPHPLPQVRCP